MASAPPQDERRSTPVGHQDPAPAGPPPSRLPEPSGASLPSLSAVESAVLLALSEARHLSVGVLRSRTGASSEDLRAALESLKVKGLIARLNTVVESYSSRFPGLRVDD